VLNVSPANFADPARDRFIQSKGHSVEALFVVLADVGFFPEDELNTLCRYKSHFVGHPTREIPGIEQNTGALGHGLSIGVGAALAGKMDAANYRVVTLLGDGELAEGSNWEAAMSASHYGLDNLTAIVDHNTLQVTGRTRDVCSNAPLEDKFASFGWTVRSADGHDYAQLTEVLTAAPVTGKPTVIIAHTTKGKGVSFMEDVVKWHHGVPNDEEYARALNEIDQVVATLSGGTAAKRSASAPEHQCAPVGPSLARQENDGLVAGGAANATMSAPSPSMFTADAQAVMDQLGLVRGRSNLEVFAETLLALARQDGNVLAVTSDSRGSGKLVPFANELPERMVEVGIAEQNLVGVAAGLAAAGKIVYAVSPACFLTARALEQIKNDVCYSDNPVKLIGISAGVSYGALGSTHHSIHDLAALRAINNIDIVVPADNFEAERAIRAAAEHRRPIYVRFGKSALFDLPHPDNGFEVGRATIVQGGTDLAFVATGETVVHAYLAAHYLQSQGVSARVISMHTVKPLDVEVLLAAARECDAMVTVEEHMVHGGLGEACARTLLENERTLPFRAVGIPDEYTITGSQSDVFRHYGISMEGLAATAQHLLTGKGGRADRDLYARQDGSIR
jgi:transketolase